MEWDGNMGDIKPFGIGSGAVGERTSGADTDVLIDKTPHDARMSAMTGRTAASQGRPERQVWAGSSLKLN